MVYIDIALLIFSIILIYRSSEWIIRYSVTLSKLLGISTFVIGFILVAVATSLPELFVTIFATLEGETTLAVADILGSNIFDLNVGIGIVVLLSGTIYMKRKETLHLIELLFITTAITLIFFSQPVLTVFHGIVLLLLGGYMLAKLYKGGRIEKEVFKDEIPLLPKEKRFGFFRKQNLSMTILKFSIAIAVMLFASKLLVDASLGIMNFFDLTAAFVGATIVAVGTSIPEVSVTLSAVRKKEYALAMGDIIGTTVTNITIVLGILAIITSMPLDVISLTGMVPFLILSTLLVWYSFSHKGKIDRDMAILLLIVYAAFILEQAGFVALFRAVS